MKIASYNCIYCKARSVSGLDEPNPALWLATQAGKMALSCLLGIARCVLQEKCPRKPYNKSFIDQACSVNMAGYWPRSFFACLWTTPKKQELGQYPAILTSLLVNNPYVTSSPICLASMAGVARRGRRSIQVQAGMNFPSPCPLYTYHTSNR